MARKRRRQIPPLERGEYFWFEPAETWEEGDRGVERFYVYILEVDAPRRRVYPRLRGGDKDGVLRYVGHTKNPAARLKEHEHPKNKNKVTRGAVVRMVYLIELPTREAATWYEWFLKQMQAKCPEEVGWHIRQMGKDTERSKRRLGMLESSGAEGARAPPRRWREGAFAPVAGRGALHGSVRVAIVCMAAVCAALLLGKVAERFVGSSRGMDVDTAAEAGVESDAGGQVTTGGREEETPRDRAGAVSARPEDSPVAMPSADEIRATATTARDQLETLHDELIGLLETRAAAAQGNDAAARRATEEVVLARIARRQDMDRLRSDIAADERWRLEDAIRHAAQARDQLQAEIDALLENPESGSRGGNAEGVTDNAASSSGSPAAQGAPVRTEGEGAAPTRRVYVEPIYPEIAKRAGVSGVVVLEAIIDSNGNVTNVRVVRSRPLLDQAAMDAVREWKYEPTVSNGVPVPIVMTVTVIFDPD